MTPQVDEFPPIWIGSIFWHEVAEKTSPIPTVEEIINQNITIQDYGPGLKAIRFVVVAVLPTNKIHEEGMEFKPRKKELYINAKLKYEDVVNASKEDMSKIVAAAFVERINLYEEVGVNNFDIARFKSDVKSLFEGKGWMVSSNTP